MILNSLVILAAMASDPVDPNAQIQDLFAALNRHDAVAIQRLYSPSAILTSPAYCHPKTGSDVGRVFGDLFRQFPDLKDEVDTVIVRGDRAAIRFTSQSDLPGKAFKAKLMTFLRFGQQGIEEDDTILDTGGRPCEP